MLDNKGKQFEMYIPEVHQKRVVPPRKAHLTITKGKAIYLSKKSMERLGYPEKINISVNPNTAEMMVWSDTNGYLFVTRGKNNGRASGTVGATGLVDKFDLPTSSRWVEIDSAPGRILFGWIDEEAEVTP